MVTKEMMTTVVTFLLPQSNKPFPLKWETEVRDNDEVYLNKTERFRQDDVFSAVRTSNKLFSVSLLQLHKLKTSG